MPKAIRLTLFASLLLAAASGTASASVVTFNLSGTLGDGSALGGSMNLDTITGLLTAADVTLGSPDSLLFTFIQLDTSIVAGTLWDVGLGTSASSRPFLSLVFPVASLVGYTGGPLCSLGGPTCGGTITTFFPDTNIADRSQLSTVGAATAPVPEPSTLSILFVGLSSLALLRRRLRDSLRG
jgi:PEP-CTERM motif-containing protein